MTFLSRISVLLRLWVILVGFDCVVLEVVLRGVFGGYSVEEYSCVKRETITLVKLRSFYTMKHGARRSCDRRNIMP